MSLFRRRYAERRKIKFYIYHTSDCSVEEQTVADGSSYEFYRNVKAGYYYGGVYNDYGFKGSYSGNGVAVDDGEAYDGSAISQKIDGKTVRYFTRTNAYQDIITPEEGQTYYLKEVPDIYFKIHARFTPVTGGVNVAAFICFDDSYYKGVGFNVDGVYTGGKIVSSYSLNDNTGTRITYRPNDLIGRRGYLTVITIESLPVVVNPVIQTIDDIKITMPGARIYVDSDNNVQGELLEEEIVIERVQNG